MSETSEYGVPLYVVVNASEITEPIDQLVKKIVKEAKEYGSVLYLTINSGKPTPPPTPPGGN